MPTSTGRPSARHRAVEVEQLSAADAMQRLGHERHLDAELGVLHMPRMTSTGYSSFASSTLRSFGSALAVWSQTARRALMISRGIRLSSLLPFRSFLLRQKQSGDPN